MARVDDLRRLAEVLWASIEAADADKRASLAAQYRATLAEIDELARGEETVSDPIDDLSARRTARGGATARPRRTAAPPG